MAAGGEGWGAREGFQKLDWLIGKPTPRMREKKASKLMPSPESWHLGRRGARHSMGNAERMADVEGHGEFGL